MKNKFSISLLARLSLSSVAIALALFSVGCCGPMGYGPGCGTGGCYDCDGTACAPMPMGPLDGIRNFKRSLVCGGGGCGETYVGEWISTPPDACDPCCGNQFVGGATKCRPFCWQPGSLLGMFNIYGQRYCSGNESSTPCGCGDYGCDGGCGVGGDYFGGEIYEGGVISGGGSSCGCASCAAKGGGNIQTARNHVSRAPSQRTTLPATSQTRTAARMDARVDRIRR